MTTAPSPAGSARPATTTAAGNSKGTCTPACGASTSTWAGPDNNTVQVMEHIEPLGDDKGKAKTVHRPFNGGKEGFEDFDANKFTMLNIMNTKMKNARKQPVSYDVVTPRMGNARHHGGGHEDCTLHDFWVTRNRPGEMQYVNVPKYVAKGENIVDTDVVLWLSTACHHEPRSEDGEMTKGGNFSGCDARRLVGVRIAAAKFVGSQPVLPLSRTEERSEGSERVGPDGGSRPRSL